MSKFLRIVAWGAIVSGVLGILLAIVSVISIWRIYGPLTTSLDKLLYVAEQGLGIVDRGLTRVDPIIGVLADSMVEIQKNGDKLAAQIEESDPIVDTLSLLLNEDVGPKVDQILETLGTIQQAGEEINAVAQTINSIPFLQVPQITEATQSFVDLMKEIEDGINRIDQLVEELKQGISQEVIGPIQDRAAQMEEELTTLQQEIQTTNAEVKAIHQAIIATRPLLPTAIGGLFALLTLQLLWGAVAQVALIYLARIYLKYGRIDLHNMLEVNPDVKQPA
jgi:hypothetical protein